MAQSLSKIHIRMNAFALPGRTTQHIHTIPRVSLRLPWAMRSLGFAMHYWLHLSNSSMLDCIRFERSFSPFETKSETLDHYPSMTANNGSHGSIIQLFCSREETLHHE